VINYFVRHPTAANLMMLGFIALGISAIPSIRRETMPDFMPSELQIRTVYPGASAEEVEEGVSQRIEDAIDGISFVEEVRSESREGFALITVEMSEGGVFATFMRDVEKEIDAIDDFPSDVEDPIIKELGMTDLVIAVLVSGPMATPGLKAYCEELKQKMKEEGLSLVEVEGFSDHQLRVELSSDALLHYGLTAADVADIVGRQSVDLPAGGIEARERDLLIRFVEQRRTPRELESLVVMAGLGGAEVRLKDIAKVSDVFESEEDKVVMKGRRAGILRVSKTDAQDTIRIARQVKAFIAQERERQPQVEFVINQDLSSELVDRLDMLVKNGWQGLVLVFLTLWLFFSFKVSFWVAMGLPMSFLGSFYFVPELDLTINMLTMVGLLLALGLMMDDAIVIAENIASHRERGKAALQSAVDGTREVLPGVVSSFITTVCILGPLISIKGQIGKVMKVVPMMLILVMAISLIEAFLILPSHLGHSLHGTEGKEKYRFRLRFEAFIDWLRERVFGRLIDFLLARRYLFLGFVVAVFIVSIAMIRSGRLKSVSFPDLEGNVVVARLLLPQGSPLERTEQLIGKLIHGLEQTNEKYKPLQPGGADLVRSHHVQYNLNTDAFESGAHVATLTVDLLEAELRSGFIDDYLADWREKTGQLPDAISLTFAEPAHGPSGLPVDVRLRGNDLHELKKAVTELGNWFAQFRGVFNLSDDLRPGKPEIRLRLREGAFGLGLDASVVANQLRSAFQGVTADEVQIGTESYEIDVRLNREDQDSIADLEHFFVQLRNGKQVPLQKVAHIERGRGWARIARINGMRAVTLRGDLDPRVANTNELIGLLRTDFLPDLQEKYPDIKVTLAGEVEESGRTSQSMMVSMVIGLLGIFMLLSFQFRSYVEPFVVLMAIPFALIGVIWGHLLMGYSLSVPSIFGFIALAGIVVNDSILLVVFLKARREAGESSVESAAKAGRQRFRAIILTSSTTIAGLLPLLFERSLQAQILIPLVISTVFGLLASTALVLLVVPCVYTILGDLGLVSLNQENHEE
jgi:multidrug efflux pump subunit AcrB